MSQLTANVKFVQKVALVHEGKVLLVKRSPTSVTRPGAWDLPGGNAEWPEAAAATRDVHLQDAVREVQEETGVLLSAQQLPEENMVLFFTYFEPEVQRYSFGAGWYVALGAEFNPGSIKLSNEHTEYVWVTANELDGYDFGEPVGTYVKTIAQKALQRTS
jgi:8-oxo-dGTP diphosphatase